MVLDGMYLGARVQLAGLFPPLGLPDAYAFREHVAEGGFLSYGADITQNYRHAATFVAELVSLKLDVIVAYQTPAVQAAKRATGTIPIVSV